MIHIHIRPVLAFTDPRSVWQRTQEEIRREMGQSFYRLTRLEQEDLIRRRIGLPI